MAHGGWAAGSDQTITATHDPETVALWLFDEAEYPHTNLLDGSDSARADLMLMDGGHLREGKYGRALHANAATGYHVAYAGYMGAVTERASRPQGLREPDGMPSALWGPTESSGPLLAALASANWTVELWVETAAGVPREDSMLMDLGQGYEPGFAIVWTNDGFEVRNAYGPQSASLPARVAPGAWRHLAFVCTSGNLSLYVDGRPQPDGEQRPFAQVALPDLQIPKDREKEDRGFGAMSDEERRRHRFNVALAEDRQGRHGLEAALDEIRISKVARYKGAFVPPVTYSRSLKLPAAHPSGPRPLMEGFSGKGPILFGARKYVFIDDGILETATDVHLATNPPTHRTLTNIVPDRSSWRPTIFDHDGKVFMLIPEGYSSEEGATHLAVSGDGITFKLERNLITGIPMYAEAFRDLNPEAAPEDRYRLTGNVANRGIVLFTSSNGRDWRRSDTLMLPLRSGGGAESYHDEQRGLYVSVLRRDSSFDGEGEAEGPGRGTRRGVQFESRHAFGAWPFRPMDQPYYEGYPFPAVTNEGETLFRANALGQVYRTRALKYPWAPDVYLAFVWRFPESEARGVELGTSRDGRTWRYWGPWYIDHSGYEEALSIHGLVRRGDELWQYSDHGGAHGGDAPRAYYRWTQRLDGFVSLNAGAEPGTAVTKPLVFAGDRLELNAEVRGQLRVALLDETGAEVPGFTLAEADVIRGDSITHTVVWAGRSDVAPLAGRPVRLKFAMRGTKLFAFEFVRPTQPDRESPRR